jgi:hypothetical protein
MFKDNCPNLPATLVKEGIRGIPPSSSEISFPAKQQPPIATYSRALAFQ